MNARADDLPTELPVQLPPRPIDAGNLAAGTVKRPAGVALTEVHSPYTGGLLGSVPQSG